MAEKWWHGKDHWVEYMMKSGREAWINYDRSLKTIYGLNGFIDKLELRVYDLERLEQHYLEVFRRNKSMEVETDEAGSVLPFPPLQLLQGGKGSPPDNWLSPLTVGTTFVVNPPDNDVFCLEFEVVAKGELAVELGLVKAGELVSDWVNPLTFCKKFKLVEILG